MTKKPRTDARDVALLLDIIERHVPEGVDKVKVIRDIFESTKAEENQLQLVVGVLYDGLAYGNWPWTPKTVEDFAKEFISAYKDKSGVEFVVVDSLTEVAQALQKKAIDNAQLKADGPQKKYVTAVLAQVTEMPPVSKARLATFIRQCYERNVSAEDVTAWLNAGLVLNADFIQKSK